LALFDTLLNYDWPFLHACILLENALFSTLSLSFQRLSSFSGMITCAGSISVVNHIRTLAFTALTVFRLVAWTINLCKTVHKHCYTDYYIKPKLSVCLFLCSLCTATVLSGSARNLANGIVMPCNGHGD